MPKPSADGKVAVAPEALWLQASPGSPELPTGELRRPRTASFKDPFDDFPVSEESTQLLASSLISRTSSALRMQRAERTHVAQRLLARVVNAAVCLQRMVRGWVTRAQLRRHWQKAGGAILRRQRLHHSIGDQSPQSVIDSGPPALRLRPQRLQLPLAMPLPPPPINVQPSGEQRSSMLNRSKSQMCTLRLLDNASIAGMPDFSPAHFDVCVRESLHDALYDSGKRHFAAGHLERALVDFTLVLRQLERLEKRAAQRENRAPKFDPEATDFRNLDDYLDKCTTGIQRRKRRATATILDQRAFLASSDGVSAKPSFWTKAQAGCLRCLASVVEVSEILGRIKKEVAPAAPPPAAQSTTGPLAGASSWFAQAHAHSGLQGGQVPRESQQCASHAICSRSAH